MKQRTERGWRRTRHLEGTPCGGYGWPCRLFCSLKVPSIIQIRWFGVPDGTCYCRRGRGGQMELCGALSVSQAPWEALGVYHLIIFANNSKDCDTHFIDEETEVQRCTCSRSLS